jgi:hypothetical protein
MVLYVYGIYDMGIALMSKRLIRVSRVTPNIQHMAHFLDLNVFDDVLACQNSCGLRRVAEHTLVFKYPSTS